MGSALCSPDYGDPAEVIKLRIDDLVRLRKAAVARMHTLTDEIMELEKLMATRPRATTTRKAATSNGVPADTEILAAIVEYRSAFDEYQDAGARLAKIRAHLADVLQRAGVKHFNYS
jgi:hypothetical protein